MRTVIGGVVALGDTVGRDLDQAAVLDSIQRGAGALLTGDRRYGKTVLCRYVADRLRKSDVLVVEVSAERESLPDFIDALERKLRDLDGRFAHVGQAFNRITEVDAEGFKVVRAVRPAESLDGLISKAVGIAAPRKLVVIIDEITVLATALERTGKGSGLQLLHLLRRLRQDHSGQTDFNA
jgi:AAA+ ATPase superfamily predicted ATPase